MEQHLPKWQYITHPDEDFNDLSWVNTLAQSGIQWVQLRIKEAQFASRYLSVDYVDFFISTGKRLATRCRAAGMLLTINDHVEWVNEIGANGAHVGKEDMSAQEARKMLGQEAILGVTVNTLTDVAALPLDELNYLGLGPFAATTTKAKEKLEPIVSLKNYTAIATTYPNTPIFAIGGIEAENIGSILQTGVHGIALSGSIFNANHRVSFIQNFSKTQYS